MSGAGTEKKRPSLGKKIKLAVLILVILFAALYVPAKFLAVKHTNRGTQLYNEGKFDEAIAQYELAMKIFPGFKPARERMGITYRDGAENAFAANNYDEAKKLYKKALKLGAEAPDVHYKLATICLGQGNNAEGLAELDKHLKNKPNDGRTAGLRRILQRGLKTKPPRRDKETKPAAERKQPSAQVGARPRPTAAAAKQLVGKPAPEFAQRDLDAKEVKLSDFKGKVVVLDFWATWCTRCVKEIPHFVELYEDYKERRFVTVGIPVDRKGVDAVKSFVEQHQVNYPILMVDAKTPQAYGGIGSIPTTFVLDKA